METNKAAETMVGFVGDFELDSADYDEPDQNDEVLCCPDCERPNQFGELCRDCEREQDERDAELHCE